jgi:uncharacterized MnhB-related membrane protein
MIPLQSVVLALTALVGLAVVLTRDLIRLAIVFGFYGFALVALFVVFQAPDVALSALVVSSVAYPLIILLAVAKVHRRQERR